MIAFPYFGSKASLAEFIISLFPQHTHYIEPFGGSGAVLLNKPSSSIETYNDLDRDVVTFFKVLREQPDELAYQIRYTPYSRDEYNLAKSDEPISDLERARRFYVKIRQGFNATTRTYTGWRREVKASRGVACSKSWQNSLPDVQALAVRLGQVQIENRDAHSLIQECDSPGALFYIDPPYVLKTRKYKRAYAHEMSDRQHDILAKLLNGLQGKVILSGYNCELYEDLYSSWKRIDIPVTLRSSKGQRVESLWLNYDHTVHLPLLRGLA